MGYFSMTLVNLERAAERRSMFRVSVRRRRYTARDSRIGFGAASALPHIFRLRFGSWPSAMSLAPAKKSEEPPCPNVDS